MIRAVISDLGKVILWFDNSIFYRRMMDYCPLSETQIREIVHKSPEFIELFDSGRMTPREFFVWATSRLGARIGYDDFMAAYTDVFWVNEPVLEIMIRLKPKYRMILVSNVDVVRFNAIRKKFPQIMIFDDYVLSFEAGVMKPNPRIYKIAIEKAGAEPAESVFIDDMQDNTDGARAQGMPAVLYRPETDLRQSLLSLGLSV